MGVAGAALLACAGSASAQECLLPPEDAVAWWPADGSVSEARAGHDAALVGGAGYAPGLVGDAFVLVGGDSRVDLPAASASGLGDFTIEFWLATTDGDDSAIVSGANASSSGGNTLLIIHTAGGLAYFVDSEPSGVLPILLNDGAWHHVALQREGDLVELYVDAVRVDSRAMPSTPLDFDSGGFMLGQEQDCVGGCLDPAQTLDGLVDELTIYRRALGPDEIAAIYDARAAGKCLSTTDPALERVEALEGTVAELELQNLELSDMVDALEADAESFDDRIASLEAAVADLEPRQEETDVCVGRTDGRKWLGYMRRMYGSGSR